MSHATVVGVLLVTLCEAIKMTEENFKENAVSSELEAAIIKDMQDNRDKWHYFAHPFEVLARGDGNIRVLSITFKNDIMQEGGGRNICTTVVKNCQSGV